MNKGWKSVKIKDLAQIIGGYAFKSKDFNSDALVPIVKIKNLKNNNIVIDGSDCVNERFLELNEKYHIEYNDILIALTGSHITLPASAVGRVAKSKHKQTLLLNQRVGKIVVDPKACNHDFLYYLMTTDYFFQSIGLRAKGAANQANVSGGDVGDIKLRVPSLGNQKKIATILSAYDDLIENNLKRIKLLEEKAQLTYEEWFVRMRFPGRESYPLDKKTGIPRGWTVKPFSDIVSVNPKTTIGKGTIAPYIPMNSISESSMVIQPIGERAVSGGTKFRNGDTLFARITPCLENGKTGFVQFMDDDTSIATGSTEYIVLRETEDCGKYFIYCTSRSERFRENAIKSMVGSDGRQRVKVECFDKYLVNFASLDLRMKFEQISEPIFKSIQLLVNQNIFLKEARDILLPRLMTGMIDVEKIKLS